MLTAVPPQPDFHTGSGARREAGEKLQWVSAWHLAQIPASILPSSPNPLDVRRSPVIIALMSCDLHEIGVCEVPISGEAINEQLDP